MTLLSSAAGGTLLILAISAGVALVAVGSVFVVNERRRRNRVRWRVGQFVEASERQRTAAPEPVLAAGPARRDPSAEVTRTSRPAEERFNDLLAPELEIAGIEARSGRIVILTVIGSLLIGLIASLVTGSPWGLVFAVLGPLATRSYVTRKVRDTRKRFAEQLPDNLDVVSSALRAGHGLVAAMSVAVDAAEEPSRSELGRALADEQLGLPLDQGLRAVAERMDSRDLEQVAFVARLQREAGTNAAEVIDQVSENIRNRMELMRLVRTLTAQGRMARWIVSLLPVGLFVAMYTINRDYLRPLWETTGGKLGMVVAAIMVVVGSLVIKQIVEIEV